MAQILTTTDFDEATEKAFAGAFQSAHLNFLIGSGASLPGIPAAGNIELEIAKLFDDDKQEEALSKMCEFVASVQSPTNELIECRDNPNNSECVDRYSDLLGIIESILVERRTDLLPKQANVFSTNYDLYVEKASERHSGIRLNDGFVRIPSLENRMVFSPQSFFDSTYNTGNLYNYKVEIPSVNLIKIHGSLSWTTNDDGEVSYLVETRDEPEAGSTVGQLKNYIRQFSVVLPQVEKFRETIMNQIYYDLLRIYQNQLDRENTLLIVFGFSFADEHILKITERALKNATLKLILFAHDEARAENYKEIFDAHRNVEIISPTGTDKIEFPEFISILKTFVPIRWRRK